MKLNFIRLSKTVLMAIPLMFVALTAGCDDDDDNKTPVPDSKAYASIYHEDTWENSFPVVITDESADHNIFIYISKKLDADAVVKVTADANLVTAYNAANGTNYEVFPTELLSMPDNGDLTIARGKNIQEMALVLSRKVGRVELAEGKTYLLALQLSVQAPESLQLSATDNVVYCIVTYESNAVPIYASLSHAETPSDQLSLTIDNGDVSRALRVSLSSQVAEDVEIKVSPSEELAAEFIRSNAGYLPFPADLVSLDNNGAVTLGNMTSANLNISLQEEMGRDDFEGGQSYVLALDLSIRNGSSVVQLSPERKALYFIIKYTPKYDVFLMIGQSNMAGRGTLTEEDTTRVLDGVWLLNGSDEPEPAVNPLNKYSTVRKELRMQGVNPGMGFGEKLSRVTGRKVLLVVNALGGSNINKWLKDATYIEDSQSIGKGTLKLFDEAVRRAKEAQKYGELKAILWHQGEANAGSQAAVDAYMGQLKSFVADLRDALGTPNVPFIAGEIAHWADIYYGGYNFNEMLHKIADQGNVPNSAYISSEGAGQLKGDSDPHFSRDGQILIGERYADKVLEMCYPEF